MIFVVHLQSNRTEPSGGEFAVADARSYYECVAWARSQWPGQVLKIEQSNRPRSEIGLPVLDVPPTLTSVELAREHSEAMRRDGMRDAADLVDRMARSFRGPRGTQWALEFAAEEIRRKAAR